MLTCRKNYVVIEFFVILRHLLACIPIGILDQCLSINNLARAMYILEDKVPNHLHYARFLF